MIVDRFVRLRSERPRSQVELLQILALIVGVDGETPQPQAGLRVVRSCREAECRFDSGTDSGFESRTIKCLQANVHSSAGRRDRLNHQNPRRCRLGWNCWLGGFLERRSCLWEQFNFRHSLACVV